MLFRSEIGARLGSKIGEKGGEAGREAIKTKTGYGVGKYDPKELAAKYSGKAVVAVMPKKGGRMASPAVIERRDKIRALMREQGMTLPQASAHLKKAGL